MDNERSRIALEGSLNPRDKMVVDLEEGKLTIGLLDYWYIVRQVGLILCGPPPRVMIPEISQSEFLEAVREQADECDCCQPDHWYRGKRSEASG